MSCTQEAFSYTAGRAINTKAYVQAIDNKAILFKSLCLAKSRKCNHWRDSGWWQSVRGEFEMYGEGIIRGKSWPKLISLYNPNRFLSFKQIKCVWFRLVCVPFKSLRECKLAGTCLLCKSLLLWETTEVLTDYLMYTQKGLFEMNHMKEETGHVYKIKYNYPIT